MAVIVGLAPSHAHDQNGMTLADMIACQQVASRLDEVIIFRSTGPWAKRWIERGYPTKNFHVKGKSSDWGPQAGFVPYNGLYSKVGYDAAKAAEGTKQNDKGIASGFADRAPLILTAEELRDQCTRGEGRPPQAPIQRQFPVPGSKDLILVAEQSGGGAEVAFRAIHRPDGRFAIHVYPASVGSNPFKLVNNQQHVPLEVMVYNEVGTDRPMTGDYDLLAICPSWAQYGSQLGQEVVKPGIALRGRGVQPEARFSAGVGLDNVLDPELHTHGTAKSNHAAMTVGGYQRRQAAALNGAQGPVGPNSLTPKDRHRAEHPDMGNLTPRILRCINMLNVAMGATGAASATRRVHHNAESHRNAMFGALTERDMTTVKKGDSHGDGFPFTIFQPQSLCRPGLATTRYGPVSTIETLHEFREYAAALGRSGFFVPKNWVWGVPSQHV
jgi:hypothetical protein